LLANEDAMKKSLGERYRRVDEMEDNPNAPRETFFAWASRQSAAANSRRSPSISRRRSANFPRAALTLLLILSNTALLFSDINHLQQDDPAPTFQPPLATSPGTFQTRHAISPGIIQEILNTHPPPFNATRRCALVNLATSPMSP
jgi:hypothetical protein